METQDNMDTAQIRPQQTQIDQSDKIEAELVINEKTSKHDKFYPNIKTNFSPHVKEHRGSEQSSTTVF